MDLLQVSLAAKTGEGIKRERLVKLGSLGRWLDRILSSRHPFAKKAISSHMLRKDNDTTERGSAMFFDNGRLDETVDNNPVIFENGSKA